jgi:NADPH:quinone reductase-like Zn-dependent oxidoreductase
MITTDAWVLHPGPPGTGHGCPPARAALSREEISLSPLGADEVLAEPLYGSWEANIDHALSRQPIDLCRYRAEDPVVLGNCGVVRVLAAGAAAARYREGDLCLVLPFGRRDRYGYAELVYGYDAPHRAGLLARRVKLREDMLLTIPADTGYSLPQWAAYGRYFIAWDNWRVAHSVWRTQMDDSDPADCLVFGWGGGVAFAELQLARRSGFRVAMTASTDERLSDLKCHEIGPVDRREFPGLHRDAEAAPGKDLHMPAYRDAEQKFLDVIDELSDGRGVAIFIDNIGAPLYKAVIKALARQGVVTTVGWKLDMRMMNIRASDCINRHLFVNTHVWRQRDSEAIRDYQASTGWMPRIDPDAIYDYDDVPRLASDYAEQRVSTYFPLFRVNPA